MGAVYRNLESVGGLWFCMSTHDEPVVVGTYQSEFEASIVKNMLVEAGIPAEVSGGTIGGFRAEAPGLVEVIVAADNAARAWALVAEHEGA